MKKQNNDFEDFIANTAKKDNPTTKKKEKPLYKSVRIYPETYEKFREIAHQQRTTVIEQIDFALDALIEKHNYNI